MKYIIISSTLFVLSIIAFFIKNGNKQLSFRQIIQISGYDLKRPYLFKNYPDILLMFSIVVLILFFHFPALMEFIGGIFIIIFQKVLILILQRLLFKYRI